MTDREGVRRTYDRIASDFARTRDRPWPAVEAFVSDRRADVALDVGCGNGRHADLLARVSHRVVGLDLSRAVLHEAADRAESRGYPVDLGQADAVALPIRDGTVDLALSIATIHHLPTRTHRVESLVELARVLSPRGTALVSAWSVSHDRFDRDRAFDTEIPWTLPSGETVSRFYHIYDGEEFSADLAESALSIERTWEEAGNCYGIVGPGEGKRP